MGVSGITFPCIWADNLIAAGATLSAVSVILVALRLYAKRMQRQRPGADDYLSILALVAFFVLAGLCIYGADRHVLGYRTSPEVIENWALEAPKPLMALEYLYSVFLPVSYGLTKLSILFFLRRIFVGIKRTTFDYLSLALIVLVVAWTVAFTLSYIFFCPDHVAASWDNPMATVKLCPQTQVEGTKIALALAGSDLILDVLLLALPFPVIWRLHLSRVQKLSVTGTFLIGVMTVIASVLRLVIYVQIINSEYDTGADPQLVSNLLLFIGPRASTFASGISVAKMKLTHGLVIITRSLYWGLLEAGLAYIAAQLPSLSPFLKNPTVRSKLSKIIPLHYLRSKASTRPSRATRPSVTPSPVPSTERRWLRKASDGIERRSSEGRQEWPEGPTRTYARCSLTVDRDEGFDGSREQVETVYYPGRLAEEV